MAFTNDVDWEFLDRVIALADDINNRSNAIKEISDDPDILLEALKMEASALIIEKLARDYRPRLRGLKKIEETKKLTTREKNEGPLGATGLQGG